MRGRERLGPTPSEKDAYNLVRLYSIHPVKKKGERGLTTEMTHIFTKRYHQIL